MECPCGSGSPFADCCEPALTGARPAPTAEACMRARYTAYTRVAMDYVLETTHPDHREEYDPENARRWAEQAEWHSLEVLATAAGGPDDETGTVEFVAAYTLDGKLFAQAKDDAIAMHCLPAHYGEEITHEVTVHPRSAIFDQAENRLHTQKALMLLLLEAESW